MTPGENRWIGVRLPVPAGAGTQTVGFAELKGSRAVSGFGIAAQPAPLNTVIGDVLGFHHKVLVRLEKGFHLPAAGAALADLGALAGEVEEEERRHRGLDVEEHVRVHERGLHIEIDVRIRRSGGEDEPPPPVPVPPGPPDAAHYERFIRRAAGRLQACLTELGRGDPFEIGVAIGEITAAASGDVGTLVTAHASVLHKFDAFLTMLQKSGGDRADILQMVRWHHALCERSTRLSALPETAGVKHRLAAFEARAVARTLQLADYATLLAHLGPALHQTAAALGAAATLDPLITTMGAAGTARARQKAHRAFLLALRLVA